MSFKKTLLKSLVVLLPVSVMADVDLVVDDISFKTIPAQGYCTDFTLIISNQGDEISNGVGRFRVQAESLETGIVGSAREFGFTSGVLQAGESKQFSVKGLHFPSKGQHIISVTIDVDNVIKERDEYNNRLVRKTLNVPYACKEMIDPLPPIECGYFSECPKVNREDFHIDPKVKIPDLKPSYKTPIPRS